MNRSIFGLVWAAASSFLLFSTACNDVTGDGGPPAATCVTTADCGGAEYCSNGTCAAKLLVGNCAEAMDHAAADVCQTGICLGGACCNSTCSASDPLCKAASCDAASGACQFPAATVSCGPAEKCVNGSHTAASTCNGAGACALAAPKACDSLACKNDGKTCLPGCHDNSTCPTGNYCAWGQCAPQLQAGATCGQTSTSPAGTACVSGACLGTFCCANPCDTTDTQCGANSCDSAGACIYPDQKTTCGALQACSGEQYTPPSACNGQGSCVVSNPHTCEPYFCNEPAAICFATCTAGGGQCALDSYCGATKCALKGAAGAACGASSTNAPGEACISTFCSGNCCTQDFPADPTTYNCKPLCDTSGNAAPKTCPNNFGCSGTTVCNTQCATNGDCFAQAFCDPAGVTACCAKYNKGDTIYIDGSNGDDANPCCGATPETACETITHAMTLVANSATSGVILSVSNTSGDLSWTKDETYPIHLGWGVTLTAPSMYFVNQTKASEIFQVYAYDATDTGTVTIQGGGSDLVSDGMYIGFDVNLYPKTGNYQACFQNSKVAINDAVNGKTALPMVLSDVWLNANDGSGTSTDLKIGAGAVVTLGPGQVEMGNGTLITGQYTYPYYYVNGYHGISCKGAGAVIQEDTSSGNPILSIETKQYDYMDIQDGCTVTVTQGPKLGGVQTSPTGWDGTESSCQSTGQYSCYTQCSYTANNGAVLLTGSANVTFGSASMPGSVNCAKYGFDQETSNASGSPTLAINGAVIALAQQHYCYGYYGYCNDYGYSCAGAMVTEGTFSASATTFSQSYMGVFIGGNAISADLSGGKNGGNTFFCNMYYPWGESGQYACGNNSNIVPQNYSGADVVNETSSLDLNVENASWDQYDTSGGNTTQVWSCTDTSYSDCFCNGYNCPYSEGRPVDGASAIYLTTNTAANPMDTTNGTQNTSGCQ